MTTRREPLGSTTDQAAPRAEAVRRWIRRHPRWTYLFYLVTLVATAVVAAEVVQRLTVRMNPSYYVAYGESRPGTVLHYPYGDIGFNSDGFPDAEFARSKTLPRVGYIGDSVCYGVGAGYGHRVTELLETAFPGFEHMNLSYGIGGNVIRESKVLEVVERFDLDAVVYLMNLNDVLPYDSTGRVASVPASPEAKLLRLRHALDWLRGRSYFYTYVRLALKNYYYRRGYEVTGHQAYELFPQRNGDVIAATARRISGVAEALRKRGVVLAILQLPYEMQISEEAARTYSGLGITWEGETFLDRGPQRALAELLPDLPLIDLYPAFVRPEASVRDRANIRVGEYFVYNAGDKLDWNHPNRAGHRRIAEYLERSDDFRALLSEARRRAQGAEPHAEAMSARRSAS